MEVRNGGVICFGFCFVIDHRKVQTYFFLPVFLFFSTKAYANGLIAYITESKSCR